jgi:lipid II:glycine glycyltransferase (peptidoglycan interpeptide bridge formation enzyme)
MHTAAEPIYRASTFKIERSPAAWSQALAKLPYAHALQSWAWADFKSRWGWSAVPLTMTIAQSSWEPLAAAMVLRRQVPRLPFSILYVPRGPALDYRDADLRRHVLAQLERVAQQERAIFIKMDPEVVRSWGGEARTLETGRLEIERLSPTGKQVIQDLRRRGWRFSADQVQFRNTVELPLEQSEEEILAGMKQKTRYNIRLAGRKGVVVRPATPADFPTIADMYLETAQRNGFAARPAAYYLDAWETLYKGGMAHPLLAEFEGRPLAAVIIVRFGERAIYMYGASTEEERQRMPGHLLQWEAIRWAKAQGCRVYDFWGAPDEFVESDRLWGVWRFKEGFNGQVVRFIGAWDYVTRPFWYWVYTAVIPRYLDFLRGRGESDG